MTLIVRLIILFTKIFFLNTKISLLNIVKRSKIQ